MEPDALGSLFARSLAVLTGSIVAGVSLMADQLPSRRADLDRRLEYQRPHPGPQPNAGAATRAAAEKTLRQLLPELQLERHPITHSPKWIATRDGFLVGARGAGRTMAGAAAAPGPSANEDSQRIVMAFVDDHADLFGHDSAVLTAAIVKRDYVTEHNGLRTTVWQQQHEGIEVFEAVFLGHVTRAGELVNVSSQFVPDVAQAAQRGQALRAAPDTPPMLSAAAAIRLAAEHLGEEVSSDETPSALDEAAGADRSQWFRARFLKGEVHARLVWLPLNEDELRLCWRILLTSPAQNAMFRLLLDADTGEVWVRQCLTEGISNASYRVFTRESPTPLLPSYSSPGQTTQPAGVARQLVTLSALDTTASPNGWINDGDNETRGNNVDAHTDLDDNDNPDTPRPAGSPARVFDFALDLAQPPSTYREAAVVNLFYWCNWMHDKLYGLGFTEAAGNFQLNNFGRGGQGNDAVIAQAQDGGGVNNANFSTPDDGFAPRMQMYIYDGANPDRDGDLDATVILHEYTHGLSNRRVGGGPGITMQQTRGLGEGWSDFYAFALLAAAAANPDACYAKGAYLKYNCQCYGHPFQASGDNYYFGSRRYPYSTAMSKNPLTFKDIDSTQKDPHAGIPISPWLTDIPAGEEHMMGEVWAMMLWECRAEMIKKHGYTTGNQLILRLVTDGMGLSPVNPNFVQARDAIYQADQVLNGGANLTELKRAFAKRGLGYYATAPGSSQTVGVNESFETVPGLRVAPPGSLSITGRVGGPFPATAKVFTLQNDGAAAAGWTLFVEPPLEANALSGTVPGSQVRTVNVTLDANAAAFFPVGVHSFTTRFTNQVTQLTQQFEVVLAVQPDVEPLVEEFYSNSFFDLDHQRLTFTPDGASGYHACRDSVSAFSVSTAAAHTLNLPDDSFAKISLAAGKKVQLFGAGYSDVYVSVNGALTFSPPTEVTLNLAEHFAQRRVSGFWRFLSTNGTSRISWQQLPDRFVATWDKVVSSYIDHTNQFQVELFYDGVIRLTYLDVQANSGIVGLSDGKGYPTGLGLADFSALADCDLAPLRITVPVGVREDDGSMRGAGMVSLPAARNAITVVNLFSSDTTELTVPATVVVPARETNAVFDLTAVNDAVRDGSQLVYVHAAAIGHLPALGRVRVDDNEDNRLTVSVPLFASESQGDFFGTLTVPNPVSGVVTVFLESSRTNEITVPPVAFIPAGQTNALFTATVVDDRRIDGNLQTTLSATVPNWLPGADAINIYDNEDNLLRLIGPIFLMEGSGMLTNAGNVYLSGTLETNLSVSLWSSNFFELLPLGPVTIPAGQTNAHFTISIGDNAAVDGVRQVHLAATAPGFSNAIFAPFIFDNDQPPEPANPHPPDLATAWPVNTHLAWNAAEGELIVNGGFETGDFTGWTVGGWGGGGWVLNDGTLDPDSPDGPRPALEGNFSALTMQNGNGRRTLSQEIFIPDGATSGTLLRWRQEIRNHAGAFAANHRFAIELRDAASDALLATLYSTTTNDPAFSAPTNRSVSLAAWRGESVRLVFVEEDALGEFNVHLDNISVIATSAAQTTYDVYFGNDTVPDETEYLGSTTNAFWDLPPLAGGLNYYWRIDSRRFGITNPGPVWRFTTAGTSVSTVPLTFGSVWKYIPTGVDLGTGWKSPTYNDNLWPSGAAPLGFGGTEATDIGDASNGYTTFYFRRRLTVNDTNRLATVTASLKRDDGAIVFINGIEAFRDNMPAGSYDYLTQASTIVNGADETNSFVHAVSPALFVEGTNIVAVEVHQRDNGFPLPGPSPDLFFDLAFTFRTNSGNLKPAAVTWLQPADFDIVRSPTNLSLQVVVSDDNLFGARVEFFGDGVKIGEDFITPFQVIWTNPPIGSHTLLATVTDAGGLNRTSVPLHVLVTPPTGQNLLTLVPAGSVWRYRQNGEFPGPNWAQASYREPRDGSWAGGPAQLGFGDGDEATAFDFGSIFWLEHNQRPITAYFRHAFTGATNLSSLTLRVLRDDGVAVYLNGGEVFRNNLPGGRLASNTLASVALGVPDENAWLTANLPPASVQSDANLVAAEVHQASASSPDLSFDLELTAVGNALPSVTLTAPANNSVFLSPPSVPLAATAFDPYGAVMQVQFLRNGISLGAVTTPPYEFNWNNPPSGQHTLTAIATDNLGATTSSSPLTVTVVPSVTLSIEATGEGINLWWPDTAPGYRLETTPDLTPPVLWQTVPEAVVQLNGHFRVSIAASNTFQYFRLRAP